MIEKIQDLNPARRLKLYIFSGGMGLFLLFYLLTLPVVKTIFRNQGVIRQARAEINEASQWERTTSGLMVQNKRLEKDITRAKGHMNAFDSSLNFLQILHQAAEETGLFVSNVKPLESESPDTRTIRIKVYGAYHKIGRFINLLEKSTALTWVEKMTVERDRDKRLFAVINFGLSLEEKDENS